MRKFVPCWGQLRIPYADRPGCDVESLGMGWVVCVRHLRFSISMATQWQEELSN